MGGKSLRGRALCLDNSFILENVAVHGVYNMLELRGATSRNSQPLHGCTEDEKWSLKYQRCWDSPRRGGRGTPRVSGRPNF